MYKDIISYKLADGVSEERLLKIAQDIIESWMCKQNGFVKWEIHRAEDGVYTDIVYWENKDSAKKAEEAMKDIPNAADWYACYDMSSISSQKLIRIGSFK